MTVGQCAHVQVSNYSHQDHTLKRDIRNYLKKVASTVASSVTTERGSAFVLLKCWF